VALAAVVDGEHPRLIVNQAVLRMTGADASYLAREQALMVAEIERRRQLYFAGQTRPSPKGRPVIIANGNNPQILDQIMAGEPAGTLFLPHANTWSADKLFLAQVRTVNLSRWKATVEVPQPPAIPVRMAITRARLSNNIPCVWSRDLRSASPEEAAQRYP